MPARPQYSSVRRGSNMRRKLTLPVEPPVPMMTALRARMFTRRALVVAVDADDAARRAVLAVERGHLVLEQILHAGLARGGVERLHQADAGRHGRALRRRAGLPVWICGQSIGAACMCAAPSCRPTTPPRRSGGLSTKTTPCASSHSKVGGAVVGEGADDLAVVVAVVGHAVRLDDRPVGEVLEQQVGRILDAVFLLHAGAAAERHVAAAHAAWPPTCGCASIRITEEPASRAAIAAGMPVAPPPITTTSAVWSHLVGMPVCADAGRRRRRR